MNNFFMTLMLVLLVYPAASMATTQSNCELDECLVGITDAATGFLIAAPDRGYKGNQRIRIAFEQLKKNKKAELVFITDKRMEPYLQQALDNFKKNHVKNIIVLPVFYSKSHPKLTLLRQLLSKHETVNDADLYKKVLSSFEQKPKIIFARPFGNTYLAVEMMIERLSDINFDKNTPLLVLGHGGGTESELSAVKADIERIAKAAIKGVSNKAIKVVVLPSNRKSKTYQQQADLAWEKIKSLAGDENVQTVLPLHMGTELDGHMSLNAWTAQQLPSYLKMAKFKQNEVEFMSLWMQREANRYLGSKKAPLGIVFHAHGSDFHWNQGMRDAIEPLTKKIPVEFAFSMADPVDLSEAVQRLEARGVGNIVILRVFGMKNSFEKGIERLIGMDEDVSMTDAKTNDHAHMRHSMDMGSQKQKTRLRTTSLVVTIGGLEDNNLFAKAMLSRALKLSKNPAKDTVIVVAHGKGSVKANGQWLEVLKSLTTKMKAAGGDQFKAIKYQTWQEDWDDQRKGRVAAIKEMVRDANKEGGQAIIIPARTTGKGRTAQFLKGETFIAGKGFAPHPLFNQWIEEQVRLGTQLIIESRYVDYPKLPVSND